MIKNLGTEIMFVSDSLRTACSHFPHLLICNSLGWTRSIFGVGNSVTWTVLRMGICIKGGRVASMIPVYDNVFRGFYLYYSLLLVSEF